MRNRFQNIPRPSNLNIKGNLTTSNILRILFVFILIFAVYQIINKSTSSDKTSQVTEVAKPKKTTNIDREFNFPLKNGDGEEVSAIKFVIDDAELRDEIIIQGKKATAIKGRDFFVLNLKITNDYSQAIEIDTRNYVRLSVNGNEDERLAPDIHNDPVKVQAISTKLTRLGIPVDEDDGSFVLFVGEIKGEKERIEVNF